MDGLAHEEGQLVGILTGSRHSHCSLWQVDTRKCSVHCCAYCGMDHTHIKICIYIHISLQFITT